jgi:hypothetical protein
MFACVANINDEARQMDDHTADAEQQCKSPHPGSLYDGGATYFGRSGSISTDGPKMWCTRQKGHEGMHQCFQASGIAQGLSFDIQWDDGFGETAPKKRTKKKAK